MITCLANSKLESIREEGVGLCFEEFAWRYWGKSLTLSARIMGLRTEIGTRDLLLLFLLSPVDSVPYNCVLITVY
jgi:hypothetical protein